MTQIATVVYAVGILGLFALDRDRNVRTSKALWLPVVWLLINGSRPVSLWLQMGTRIDSPDKSVDGSPLDAFIFGILLMAAIIVLVGRRQQVGAFLQANWPILLFFAYCAFSTLWSDYTIVAIKRWIKAVGDVVMVLIVLTDPERAYAIKRLLARVGFLLIPVSILLIKYYPDMSRYYSLWEGRMFVSGVAEDKNMLGMTCLVFGLGAWWRFLGAWRDQTGGERMRQVIASGSVVAMAAWLLWMADSMTSLSCFVMAGGLLAMTTFVRRPKMPVLVHFMAAAIVCVAASALFLDVGGGALQTMGRNPTLTGRTEIWRQLLNVNVSPLVGTGFESFWVGERLRKVWAMGGLLNGLNEAHNGYLEVFLNLGWIGVVVLAVLIVTGYRNVVVAFRRDQESARLGLAFLVAMVVYSLTEAGFRMMSPIWIAFLLTTAAVSDTPMQEESSQFAIYHEDEFAAFEPRVDQEPCVRLRQWDM